MINQSKEVSLWRRWGGVSLLLLSMVCLELVVLIHRLPPAHIVMRMGNQMHIELSRAHEATAEAEAEASKHSSAASGRAAAEPHLSAASPAASLALTGFCCACTVPAVATASASSAKERARIRLILLFSPGIQRGEAMADSEPHGRTRRHRAISARNSGERAQCTAAPSPCPSAALCVGVASCDAALCCALPCCAVLARCESALRSHADTALRATHSAHRTAACISAMGGAGAVHTALRCSVPSEVSPMPLCGCARLATAAASDMQTAPSMHRMQLSHRHSARAHSLTPVNKSMLSWPALLQKPL